MRSVFLAVFAFLALLAILPVPARADLRLCNRTSYILYAATSTVGGAASLTQGWTRIAPGDCQSAIKGPLGTQSYLVYARSALAHSGPQRAWGGNFPVCVRDNNFSLRLTVTTPVCNGGDSYSVPFAAVATQGRRDFTMTFDEQPAYRSLIEAQLAGAKRLLKDNGFPIPAVNGTPDKVTGKALNDFRARMHFAPGAGNDALFTALENQASVRTAPAGYTVCNDTKEDLLVAMGESQGKVQDSRGWWRIAAGVCARTITNALASDAIWLLAQKRNGDVVAGGPDIFCVTPQEFDIPRRSDCAGHGFSQAGFARTATRGLSGTVVHIGAAGLTPALAPHPGMLK